MRLPLLDSYRRGRLARRGDAARGRGNDVPATCRADAETSQLNLKGIHLHHLPARA